ncbi:YfcE family phosphodiesterase [Aerococcus sp. 1KP-2016]|jgi:putative phosphoesterase|uniref:YfcE family phosphodiesterase n=1 Tax=Aerococcus sp. 1KP-2016 TaxID=1981982 RepID=UPI000B98E022|nr:metallophosphoesterase [Aerococcus sp. 1KP-2016]OYQ65250.1 YfcE family phosphodiesterase [Aerococcus sp. 1KP-2016]
MKILITSDNHGDHEALLDLVVQSDDDIDVFIHCGDSELAEDDNVWGIFHTVQGNMDYGHFKDAISLSTPEGKIVVTHGHLNNVNRSLDNLVDLAKANDADIVMYGHTHVMDDRDIDGVKVINPGSISQPRGKYPYPSFAILDWEGGKKEVTFYNKQWEVIDEIG